MKLSRRNEESSADFSGFALLRVLAIGAVVALVMVGAYGGGWLERPGELVDPDCYMWLLREQRIHETGRWMDAGSLGGLYDFPVLHWTLPFDWALYGPASLLSVWTGDFGRALFLWGIAVSPVLLVGTLGALVFGWRRILEEKDLPIAALLSVTSPGVLIAFQSARPDHQSLSLLVLAGVLSALMGAVTSVHKNRAVWWALLAGALTGIGMWVSVEALMTVLIAEACLGILWILRGGDRARLGLYYSLGLFLVSFGAGIIQYAMTSISGHRELDSVSIPHVSALLISVLAWEALASAAARRYFIGTIGKRLAAAGGAIVFVLGAIYFFVGAFYFHGPYGGVNPEVARIWLAGVQEAVPLVTMGTQGLAWSLLFIGPAVVAAGYSWYRWKRTDPATDGWFVLVMALTLFSAASLGHQSRWTMHASLLASAPLAAMLGGWIPRRVPARLLFIILAGSLFSLAGAGVMALAPGSPVEKSSGGPSVAPSTIKNPPALKSRSELPFRELCEWIKLTVPGNDPVLAFINLGPELMYRTGHRTVAVPYHRDTAGILDAYHIMTAFTDDEARAGIQRRGVAWVLLAPTLSEEPVYYDQAGKKTFYRRLLAGAIPDWLEAVTLPEPLATDFRLYRVRGK